MRNFIAKFCVTFIAHQPLSTLRLWAWNNQRAVPAFRHIIATCHPLQSPRRLIYDPDAAAAKIKFRSAQLETFT